MESIQEKNANNENSGAATVKKTAQDPSNFVIKQATLDDHELYVKFLNKYFACREPLTLALKVDPNEITEFLSEQLIDWLGSGASVCAVHTPTKQLAGVLFAKILTRDDSNTFDLPSPKFLSENHRRLMMVLHHMENLVNLFEDSKIEKILEIAVVSTNPEFAGNRLGYRLIGESENLGLKLGCQMATMQATNVITQHIASKTGYEECATLDYTNIIIDDTKIDVDPNDLNGTTSGKVVKKIFKINSHSA